MRNAYKLANYLKNFVTENKDSYLIIPENRKFEDNTSFKVNSECLKDSQIEYCDTREESFEEKINEISIIFRGDFDEHLLMLNVEMTLREMFNKFLIKYTPIRSIDIDKIFFIYNSKLLNKPCYLDMALKNIFGMKNNSIVQVIIPEKLVSSN